MLTEQGTLHTPKDVTAELQGSRSFSHWTVGSFGVWGVLIEGTPRTAQCSRTHVAKSIGLGVEWSEKRSQRGERKSQRSER